ncbi:MAG: hypothetical protein MJ169_04400 [Treponema sp.]|nr:hypothetical protein [Treponema sp.]
MKTSVNRILTIILISIAGVLVFCTITAFLAGKASFSTYRRADPDEKSVSKDTETQVFKELGSLRLLTKSDNPEESTATVLVITPWFSFTSEDNSFYEELSLKKGLLVSCVSSYFASYTQKELLSMGEKKVKQELCDKLNSILEMGKIKAVFFDEYIFFD